MLNKKDLKHIKKHERELVEDTQKISAQLKTTITTALALVVALFWQSAITDTIKVFIDVDGVWVYELVFAFVITILATIVMYYLAKK